jgi:hypothetical protein
MRWLPEYGVGLIAFGNLTYTVGGGNAFDLLLKTGGLQPRAPQPSPALTMARDTVSRLVNRWDDREADRIAADNLFLDRPKEKRREEFASLRSQLGICTSDGTFDSVENALRGQWTMTCERGKARGSITLAPTMPPRVQYLELAPAKESGGPSQSPVCQE